MANIGTVEDCPRFVDNRRILFGTDFPLGFSIQRGAPVGRPRTYASILSHYRELLPRKILDQVCYRNATRLLRMQRLPQVRRAVRANAVVILPDLIGTTICAIPALRCICSGVRSTHRLSLLGVRGVADILLDEPSAGTSGFFRISQHWCGSHKDFWIRNRNLISSSISSPPGRRRFLRSYGSVRRVGWDLYGIGGHDVVLPLASDQSPVLDYLSFPAAVGL